MINERYKKNIGNFISEQLQNTLLTKTFLIIGCGGNGEYFADFLIRLGVKKIILFDKDNFEYSNINRQIYYKINENKAKRTGEVLNNINPEVNIEFYEDNFDFNYIKQNNNIDMIIYCADYIYPLKDDLEKIINKKIPILFQGITNSQVTGTIFTYNNKKEFLNFIENNKYGVPENLKNISQPAFLCALSASLGCTEIIKYFSNIENYPSNFWFQYNYNL